MYKNDSTLSKKQGYLMNIFESQKISAIDLSKQAGALLNFLHKKRKQQTKQNRIDKQSRQNNMNYVYNIYLKMEKYIQIESFWGPRAKEKQMLKMVNQYLAAEQKKEKEQEKQQKETLLWLENKKHRELKRERQVKNGNRVTDLTLAEIRFRKQQDENKHTVSMYDFFDVYKQVFDSYVRNNLKKMEM